jgi:hypothetical protein
MGRAIVALPSIHDVMRMEKALKGSGIRFDIIPTPTSLSTNCGMVIEVAEDELPALLARTRAEAIENAVCYRETVPGSWSRT